MVACLSETQIGLPDRLARVLARLAQALHSIVAVSAREASHVVYPKGFLVNPYSRVYVGNMRQRVL